uniref:Uncharacterized protein n=1 Tax=Anguilla anguilla TaxID=7936 RepID=A0A0E9U270_ANGAN
MSSEWCRQCVVKHLKNTRKSILVFTSLLGWPTNSAMCLCVSHYHCAARLNLVSLCVCAFNT